MQYNLGSFNESILKKYGQEPDNIFHIQSQQSDMGLHPTQKPLKLMELLIELTTIEGQIVCDPFCGSGTTLIAALRLNRKFIGFEKEGKYYNITLDRINEENYKKYIVINLENKMGLLRLTGLYAFRRQ